jgi:hypothetical protein
MLRVSNIDVHLTDLSCSSFNKAKTNCKFLTYDYKGSFFVIIIHYENNSIREVAFPANKIDYIDCVQEYSRR